MKAVRFHKFGGADVLVCEDVPVPRPGRGEVVIGLKAAALNHIDVWLRKGVAEKNLKMPHIPGSDGAGVVAEAGEGVGAPLPGENVLVSPGISCGVCGFCLEGRDNFCPSFYTVGTKYDGTYAEYVKIPAVNAVPVPPGLSFEQAASVPLVFLTSWHMLVSLARIARGDTVLVHGAASGVGSAAVQIAKLFGAFVIATAGTEEKLKKAMDMGADEGINYTQDGFAEEVKRLTGKKGVDVVFEHIGGKIFSDSIPLLSKGGRLVTCGATSDFNAKIDLRYVFSRQLSVYGSYLGTKRELLELLKFFGETGHGIRFRPVIDSVFPLERAAEAQLRMEGRNVSGKIVLSI